MDVRERFYSKKFAKNLGFCDRLRKIKTVFEQHHFSRILDVGCGDGSFSVVLSNFSDEMYGIDIAENAVEAAKEKI